jgi:hypothetical protein
MFSLAYAGRTGEDHLLVQGQNAIVPRPSAKFVAVLPHCGHRITPKDAMAPSSKSN